MKSSGWRLSRQVFAGIVFYSGMLWLWRRLFSRHPLIVYYHEVCGEGDDTSWCNEPSLLLQEDLFRTSLEYLNTHYEIVSLDEIPERQPGQAVAVTFDDGYGGVYRRAFPILRRLGVPATAFVVTDFIGGKKRFWWDRLIDQARKVSSLPEIEREKVLNHLAEVWRPLFSPELMTMAILDTYKRANSHERERMDGTLLEAVGAPPVANAEAFLSEAEIKEMASAGIGFGAHSKTHPLLTWLDDKALATEVEGSRRALETITGKAPCWFAYPDGFFNERAEAAVRKAGVRGALQTFRCDRTGPFAMRRVGLNADTITGVRGEFSRARLELALAQLNRRSLKRLLKSALRALRRGTSRAAGRVQYGNNAGRY